MRRTATLKVVEVGHTAAVVKARIVINVAWRSVIPRYGMRCRLRHVHQCAGLVKLQFRQNMELLLLLLLFIYYAEAAKQHKNIKGTHTIH